MPDEQMDLKKTMVIDAESPFKDDKPDEVKDKDIEDPKSSKMPDIDLSIINQIEKAEIEYRTARLGLEKANHEYQFQKDMQWVALATDGLDKDLGLTNDTKRGAYVNKMTYTYSTPLFEAQQKIIKPEAHFNQLERLEKRERLELMVRLLASKQDLAMLLDLLR